VSYTAPHFPLQARPDDIAKYRGKYKVGWDSIRQQRYERLVEMGLINKAWKMSPLDEHVPKWEDVQDKESADLNMAVYAAMIDRMDQGIGRILGKVRELSIQENTLVMFLSDNGSCAEDFNAFNTTNKEVPPGPMESYRTLGVGWANASNTPFRKYKWWNHEGGMATPMIAYWPKVIKNGGQITHQVGHLIDIMATCTDIAGAESSLSSNGDETFDRAGKSLLPILRGEERQGHEAIYWKFGSSYAVRKGKWKLVASHPNARTGIDYFSERDEFGSNGSPDRRWELYDMALDRTELNDLAAKHPEKVKEMADLFDAWAAEGHAQ
jgi:arylsulfatase A-like enzyme